MRIGIFLVCCAIALGGCSDSEEVPLDDGLSPGTAIEDQIRQQLRLLDTFEQESTVFNQGEPIRFSLSLVNESNEDRVFEFNTGCQSVYRVLEEPVGSVSPEVVYDSQTGAVCTQALTTLEISAQQTVILERTWDQTSNLNDPVSGVALEPGNYQAQARIFGLEFTSALAFTIQ